MLFEQIKSQAKSNMRHWATGYRPTAKKPTKDSEKEDDAILMENERIGRKKTQFQEIISYLS
jgi:hypothetical protein